MNQYDITFDLKIPVGHSDLYFMVQWFAFILKSSKINPASNFTRDQAVTYCYRRDIRTQKSSKINSTSNFTVTKKLPVSYLLLPKRYKDTKIIENKSNIQFYKWPSSYQSVTYCYQRDIRTQKSSKSNIQCYKWPSSYQSVTYCYQRDIRRQKPSKINPIFNFTSDPAITSQLPTVTKEI